MPVERDRQTLRFYDQNAPEYVAGGLQGPSRHLIGFVARLAEGARVLELGCGGGRDAIEMIAAGLQVTLVDASTAMAKQAEARTGLPVRVMGFDEIDARSAYDGIFANASLLHVPREAMSGILTRIHTALRPGGWHFASYKAGLAEGRDEFGRFFNYPDVDWLRATYGAAGLRVDTVQEYPGGSYRGVLQPWIGITVQR